MKGFVAFGSIPQGRAGSFVPSFPVLAAAPALGSRPRVAL